MRDLLPITTEIPELEEGEPDVLGEIVRNSTFDSQLYLFETAGILTSLTFKTPERQASLLLSLVKPLMDDLSANLQSIREKGWNKEDLDSLLPIVKVHHIIMALGNIAKGFPDYPAVIPDNYIMPPLEVFAEVAKAILVCLEAMNVFKVVRDAVSVYYSSSQCIWLIRVKDPLCFCEDFGYRRADGCKLYSTADGEFACAF